MENSLFQGGYSSNDDVFIATMTDDDLCSDFEDSSVRSDVSPPSPYIRPILAEKKDNDDLSGMLGGLSLDSEASPLSNSPPTGLRGIVYKMDNNKKRAYVRVAIQQDECHAAQLPSSQFKPVDMKHLYIPYTRILANKDDVDLGSQIRILEHDGCRLKTCLQYADDFEHESEAEITRYKVDILASNPSANELVAITEINANFVKVVGSNYRSMQGVAVFPWNRNPKEFKGLTLHSFLYGELIHLPKFYVVTDRSGVPELVFNHDKRLNAIKTYEAKVKAYGTVEHTTSSTGKTFIRKLRSLTSEEVRTIENQTRNLSGEITYKLATQYVRDVMLTSADLEEFIARESVKEFSCEVTQIEFEFDTMIQKDVIYVPLTKAVKKCLTVRGRDTWHLGTDLVLGHQMFLGKNGIPVIIDNTGMDWKNKKYIRLVGGAGSDNILDAIKRHPGNIDFSGLTFRLGPMAGDNNRNADAIRIGFEHFYHKQFDLFEAYIGRSAAPDMDSVPKVGQDFYIQGQKLDESQRSAMRTALGVPGFTCVSAPPGSGKTFMISGLVAAKLQENPKARFAISAATNIAVTNAVEMVHEKFPNGKKVRQFSRKAEAELGKNAKILEISLKKLTRDPELVKQMMKSEGFAKAVAKRDRAQEKMKEQAPDIARQIGRVAAYQNAESRVGVEFINAYGPTVYGTTGSIMARNIHHGIEHLIVDEAGQMSQVDALSLYCRLPDVKYITLLGDSRQLGPFTDMEEGSLARKLTKIGELTRLEKLQSSAKRELQFIYRCHPRIIDVLLKPIYGNQLQAGTPASARSLALDMDLPRAKDGSPCLFVQVDGTEEGGRNKEEADLVVEFLYKLQDKGIQSEDVNVICHHRAQRESLCHILKGKGNIGHLNLLYGVNTVDSFQGKEAKVVLVLTTKTCHTWDDEILARTLSFISDPNRETVAVSRAEHAIYIFGDWPKLAQMPFWNQFGAGIVKSGAIVNEKWEHIPDPGWTTKPNMLLTPEGSRVERLTYSSSFSLSDEPHETKKNNTVKKQEPVPTGGWPVLGQQSIWDQNGNGSVESEAHVPDNWVHFPDPVWVSKPSTAAWTPRDNNARRLTYSSFLLSDETPKTKKNTSQKKQDRRSKMNSSPYSP